MLRNFDIPILVLELKGGFAAASDQHVDLVDQLGMSSLFRLEIIGDFPGRGLGNEVKRRVGRNVSERVAVLNRRAD